MAADHQPEGIITEPTPSAAVIDNTLPTSAHNGCKPIAVTQPVQTVIEAQGKADPQADYPDRRVNVRRLQGIKQQICPHPYRLEGESNEQRGQRPFADPAPTSRQRPCSTRTFHLKRPSTRRCCRSRHQRQLPARAAPKERRCPTSSFSAVDRCSEDLRRWIGKNTMA